MIVFFRDQLDCTIHDMNVKHIFSSYLSWVLFWLTSSSIFQVLPRRSSLIFESLDHNPQMLHHWVLGDPGCEGNAFPTPQPQLLGSFRCLKMQISLPRSGTPSHTLQPSSPWTVWLVWPYRLTMSQSGASTVHLIGSLTTALNSSPWPFSIRHRPVPSAAAARPFRPLPALLPFDFGMARPAASASPRRPGPPPRRANPPGLWPGRDWRRITRNNS